MPAGKLTPKQQRFVELYVVDPNATKAAREAGYSAKTSEVQGCRLLKNVQVAKAIEAARAATARATIADAVERREFWTLTLRDKGADMKDRLRASELLGKADGDFVEITENREPAKLRIVKVLFDGGSRSGSSPAPGANGVH